MDLIGPCYINEQSANIRIITNDGVVILMQLFFEKRMCLKLQKSLYHKSTFKYHTSNKTYIRGNDNMINIYGPGISSITLHGEIWISRLAQVIDDVISQLYTD
jgi:hypothetical protein